MQRPDAKATKATLNAYIAHLLTLHPPKADTPAPSTPVSKGEFIETFPDYTAAFFSAKAKAKAGIKVVVRGKSHYAA